MKLYILLLSLTLVFTGIFVFNSQNQYGLHLNWEMPSDLNKNLPEFMKIYFTDSEVQEQPFNAWYLELDYQNNQDKVELIVQYGIGDNKLVTPEEYAINYEKKTGKKVFAVMNGGFFNMDSGESLSLTISYYELLAIIQTNQKDGQYPSIGAFGINYDGSSEAVFAHQIKNGEQYLMYAWDHASPDPQIYPDEYYPENGYQWQPKQAIGGGPLLLKNGTEQDGDKEEFNDNIMYGEHPRTAICKTSDNKLVLYVNDGRSDLSVGLKIDDLTHVMKSIDCIDAINLDGGGSTCLYVNGQVVNVPSDGHQRPISTAILIVEK